MVYSATVKYLANQILIGKLTYLQVVNSTLFTVTHTEYRTQLDAYIDEFDLNIDKNV